MIYYWSSFIVQYEELVCRHASGLAERPQHPIVRCPTCKEKVRQWSRGELARAGVKCGEPHSNKAMMQSIFFIILYEILCAATIFTSKSMHYSRRSKRLMQGVERS